MGNNVLGQVVDPLGVQELAQGEQEWLETCATLCLAF